MSTLALDISTSVGWAFFKENVVPNEHGTIVLPTTVSGMNIAYPWNYVEAARQLAASIISLVKDKRPYRIVVEETNLGSSRYSQKILEMIHLYTLLGLEELGYTGKVFYVSSSMWRRHLGVQLSTSDKANNKVLSKAKKNAKEMGSKLDKKALGVKGKITLKHVAIRYVKEKFGLELIAKDDDIADAVCLGWAFIGGAPVCDGK